MSQSEIANLVQEERAAIGKFPKSYFGRLRVSECARNMAKKLRFQQFGWDSAAIDLDKTSLPVTEIVDGTGNDALPCPRFAKDKQYRQFDRL